MITSALLAGIPRIVHAFGTEAELVPGALQPVWDERPHKKQVHGARLAHITGPRQHVGEADAFDTSTPGIPVSVITADCVPLLLAKRDGSHVAAVHAGWRGLMNGIIPATVQALHGGAGWVAAIGPTICASCYEVNADLAADFARRFPAIPSATLLPQPRHLDLRAVAAHQLQTAGITAIDHVGGCTCCARSNDGDGDGDGAFMFRSYRRGDRNSQQHAGLYIQPNSGGQIPS